MKERCVGNTADLKERGSRKGFQTQENQLTSPLAAAWLLHVLTYPP